METSHSDQYAVRNTDAPMMSRTHCIKRGHRLSEGGVYRNGQCRPCKKLDNAARAKAFGGWAESKSGRPKPSKRARMAGFEETPVGACETKRVAEIMALIDAKWKASTRRDRQEIQNQINELGRRAAV